MIGGRHREVAFLVARPVAQVVLLAAGIPAAFFGVDEVEAGVLVLVEADVVEDEELGFGAEVRGIADAAVLQIQLGLLGDPARIALVVLLGDADRCTSPIITSVGVSANGSMNAVFGSGISSMSLSLIAAQPRMLDPSMPKPSSNELSVSSLIG